MLLPGLLVLGELPAELAPLSEVAGTELQGLEAAQCAADDRARGGVLAVGGTALVMPESPEGVLEVVVGKRLGSVRTENAHDHSD